MRLVEKNIKARIQTGRIFKFLAIMSLLLSSHIAVAQENHQVGNVKASKTLRLLIPEWQGGDYDIQPSSGEIYPMGARLMAFLAPKGDSPIIEVPIDHYTAEKRPQQNGVVWQDVLLRQLKVTQNIIQGHKPERIITFGGTCLVSQAPFSYLNELYGGNVGVIWIDAHPDISTPSIFNREHAMVLGNLLGKGDPAFAKEVRVPFKKDHVLLIGVDHYHSVGEQKTVQELGLKVIPSHELIQNDNLVKKWIQDQKIEHVVIHVDIDVLDPKYFFSQLTNNPAAEKRFDTVTGKMTISQLTKIITDISGNTDVVGISFAEHMPWDALNLKNMMEQFSFMK